MIKAHIGVDVGSVSTDIAIINDSHDVLSSVYIRTHGRPIESIQKGLQIIANEIGRDVNIISAGTTGSGRQLAGILIGADVIKNEITAHAVSAIDQVPKVQTIFEIGGQDSKFIILKHGVVTDFAMNNVCAAGTGSFLDQQALRLGIPIDEFGNYAIKSKLPAKIAGRCTVFAESDMIHKQQMGYSIEDIIAGLCKAMVRNYLNNVVKGKKFYSPISFQGGVASNIGIRNAFEMALNTQIEIPKHFKIMGAIGAAILAKQKMQKSQNKSLFRGFETSEMNYKTVGFDCDGCSNGCEIIEMLMNDKAIARWGSKCGKWNVLG